MNSVQFFMHVFKANIVPNSGQFLNQLFVALFAAFSLYRSCISQRLNAIIEIRISFLKSIEIALRSTLVKRFGILEGISEQ